MKVLTSWLREFVNPKVSDYELAETLTMAGLEVDNITTIAPEFSGVVIGDILTCEKHPNADKLNLCQVNIGIETLQIICGAKNVRSGLKVVVATNGAILPGNFKIKKAKLRGITSNGMICSVNEIGLKEQTDGIMELDKNAPIGKNIRDFLKLDETIIELDITPNRSDCFSILGVAREVCANYNLNLLAKINTTFSADTKITSNKKIITTVENPQHCPKYLTRAIEQIDNTVKIPFWMKEKLINSGQSLHSAVVDIINFVLLELGQPMHAFDRDKINTKISVRLAKYNEKITLLNGQKIDLTDDTLIIADDFKPIAIAGIMGGMDSATTENTTIIVLESAFFDNILIAGKARSYSLHTESSLRFERGVDFNLAEVAIKRATDLILEICGGKAGEISSVTSEENIQKVQPITIFYQKINKTLGFLMDKRWIVQKFKALNFTIIDKNENSITIIPPSFRFDIKIEVDLIEELARLYGYDKLPTSNLRLEVDLSFDNNLKLYDLKKVLTNRNYNEVITYSFIDDKMSDIIGGKKIKLINPISNEMSVMRTSLIAGLLKTAVDNINQSQSNLRIFESGLCFDGVESEKQIEKIAGLITGEIPSSWIDGNREYDFYDIKADVLSLTGKKKIKFIEIKNNLLQLGQSASIVIDDEEVGIIGLLSPQIQKQLSLSRSFIFELNLTKLLIKSEVKYKEFSNYQTSNRDISLLFSKKIDYQQVIDKIISIKQKYLITVKLIDVWSGKEIDNDQQSLTFSLSYQADNKTLIDEQIDGLVAEVLKILINKFNAIQR